MDGFEELFSECANLDGLFFPAFIFLSEVVHQTLHSSVIQVNQYRILKVYAKIDPFFLNLVDSCIRAGSKGQPLVFSIPRRSLVDITTGFCRYFAKFQINIDEPMLLLFI